MFKDFFQLYQIGKELGLTRKEINGLLFFNDKTNSLKSRIIFHIILLFFMILIGIVLLGFIVYPNTGDTYGSSGTRYSTIRIKDFKKKLRYFSKIKF